MSSSITSQRRLGPITLAAGVDPKQVLIFLAVVAVANFVNQFMAVMQPLVLNQQLHVPSGQQGVLSGFLGTTQQLGTLLFIGMAGALSDVVGRRMMLVVTLVGFSLCLFFFPFIAFVWALFATRFVWGAAFTGWTAGGATLAMDYPDNNSRGKLISLVLVTSAASAFLFMGLVGRHLPVWFRDAGFADADATRYSFWILAVISLLGGIGAMLFLNRHQQRAAAPPSGKAKTAAGLGQITGNVRAVFAHAKINPRFALILLIGCIVRTDSVVILNFLSLWVVNAGHLVGVEAIKATETAGLLAAILQGVQFVMMPMFGFLVDRVDRVRLLLFALALTTIAFCAFGLISDVFGAGMIAAILFVGFADSAQSIAAQALVAQEAPVHLRGSTMGVFAFLGTSSLLIVNMLGGKLFDKIGFSAPFVMEGVLHLVFFALAVMIVRSPKFRRFRADEQTPIGLA